MVTGSRVLDFVLLLSKPSRYQKGFQRKWVRIVIFRFPAPVVPLTWTCNMIDLNMCSLFSMYHHCGRLLLYFFVCLSINCVWIWFIDQWFSVTRLRTGRLPVQCRLPVRNNVICLPPFPHCHLLPLSAIIEDFTPLVTRKNKLLEVTWCMKHPLITRYDELVVRNRPKSLTA